MWRAVAAMLLWNAIGMSIYLLSLELVNIVLFLGSLSRHYFLWLSQFLWFWYTNTGEGCLVLKIRNHSWKALVYLLNYFLGVTGSSIEKLRLTLGVSCQ